MILRNAQPGDAAGIAKVRVDTWTSAYKGLVPDEILKGLSYEESTKNFKKYVENLTKNEFSIVAEDHPGGIVGRRPRPYARGNWKI